MGHVVPEQFLWKSQNLFLKAFEKSEFSTEKSEKCEFFEKWKCFSNPPRKFSWADMDIPKVWKMLP